MLLKTDRLMIRMIAVEDWRAIQAIWMDFNANPLSQYDIPHPTDDEDVRSRIARWAAVNGSAAHMFFAVCLGDSVIGYSSFNLREGGYEIGYCFHSAYHGKGYAKESLMAIFAHLRTRGITKFLAGTAIKNIPSVALLNSLGFSLVGTENVSFYQDDRGNDIVFQGGIFELNTEK